MEDDTERPLMPPAADSSSTDGEPVCGTHGERFLSWFQRFRWRRTRRRASLPPPPPRPAPQVNPESLAVAAAGFTEAAAGSALGDEAKSFAGASQAFAEAEEPRASRFAEDFVERASALTVAADLVLQQEMSTATTTGLAFKAMNLSMDSQALLPAFNMLPPSSAFDGSEEWTGPRCSLSLAVQVNSAWMHQEKLAEKRQVIFGISLSTPIALLTTMKAGSVLPDEHTAWVGGLSASMWVLVNAGFMMNLYGKTRFELRAAQHLSRLGMLGLAILVCIYMYLWFFPSVEALFWILHGVVVLFHCLSWLVGCCRHDDDSTFSSAVDEEGLAHVLAGGEMLKVLAEGPSAVSKSSVTSFSYTE